MTKKRWGRIISISRGARSSSKAVCHDTRITRAARKLVRQRAATVDPGFINPYEWGGCSLNSDSPVKADTPHINPPGVCESVNGGRGFGAQSFRSVVGSMGNVGQSNYAAAKASSLQGLH